MKNGKIVVGLYTRVSTQEQAAEGYSIGEQKARLEKYADAHDWIVFKWYNDPGFSGGSIDRPAITSLIHDVERHKLDKVLVYKLDRLSRSQKDTLYLIEDVFLKNGVDFVSMTENFDTGTPLGRAMIGILSVFAQLEREQIKERMQVGLDARAKEGLYHGGPYAPIGYDYTNGELIVNDYESMQVKKIYDLFLSGMPIYAIYKHMAEHYVTKYGNWSDSAVRSCLKTPIYSGVITWKNKTYAGKHDAIIPIETFEKVQVIINTRNTGKFPKQPFKRTTLLGGLLWCGNCGARYFCKQNTVRKNHKPGTVPQKYYTCYSRGKTQKHMIKDPTCKNKSWNMKDLDKLILNEIEKLALDPDKIQNTKNKSESEDSKRTNKIINKRLADIDKQVNKLIDLYQIETIDFNMINNKIKKLTDEKANLENELGSLETVKPEISIQETKVILNTFTEVLNSANSDQLRDIVHSLIDGIIINGDDLEIHWKFA